MEPETTVFAIPTYRLRDVAETIEAYDTNFWRNSHAVKLILFDDSASPTTRSISRCSNRSVTIIKTRSRYLKRK